MRVRVYDHCCPENFVLACENSEMVCYSRLGEWFSPKRNYQKDSPLILSEVLPRRAGAA
ncbi:hypothetical protein DEO72_LG5g1144 [Vigna unguiculata]|uniref:Uncharacterized protein n=1 Tax=Vigna unguiculata TaxID=3917 RepID=A0A4D6LX61_VIGUN|nr:hypothetical protein DEO72_LG5g1144 [Vigna unguiculata]